MREAKVSGEVQDMGSLQELTVQHQQRLRARERLHGPALDFGRQFSEGSDLSLSDLDFLFTGESSA